MDWLAALGVPPEKKQILMAARTRNAWLPTFTPARVQAEGQAPSTAGVICENSPPQANEF